MDNTVPTTPGVGPATPVRESAPLPQQQSRGRGLNELGQADFLRLLTVQIQQQDPLEPVDNTDMLAQMAQFSTLAGTEEMNSTLEQIAAKLDLLIAAESAR